jgi:hypothetical protein
VIAAGQLNGKDLATIYVLRASVYRAVQQYNLAIDDMSKAIDLLRGAVSNDTVASAYVRQEHVAGPNAKALLQLASIKTGTASANLIPNVQCIRCAD